MRRFLKVIIVILIIAFIALQFFQPEKNAGEFTANHIFQSEQVPEDITITLKKACMDCHSDQTTYLWYDNVAPASWMVKKHIDDAKKELNFSAWGEQDSYDKFGAFEDISKEVERKTMPFKSYTFMHRNARLTAEERKALVDWCKKRTEEIMVELKEE